MNQFCDMDFWCQEINMVSGWWNSAELPSYMFDNKNYIRENIRQAKEQSRLDVLTKELYNNHYWEQ